MLYVIGIIVSYEYFKIKEKIMWIGGIVDGIGGSVFCNLVKVLNITYPPSQVSVIIFKFQNQVKEK